MLRFDPCAIFPEGGWRIKYIEAAIDGGLYIYYYPITLLCKQRIPRLGINFLDLDKSILSCIYRFLVKLLMRICSSLASLTRP
jgi:hypothetical protein